jgi:glycosyltransferase involved in cell wall biosynthesis
MKELVKEGHNVTLIGHPSSKVEEYGIKLIPLDKEHLRGRWDKFIPDDIDIIHLQYNNNLDTKIPVICTMHGNGQATEICDINTVFVSKNQAENHNGQAYIYNALNFDEYEVPANLENKKEDNLLFLGKVSWKIKNVKDCKRVAKKTKKHLHIAGGRSFSLSRYIHNYGFIGGEEKLKLLQKCDALLFPVRWNEPFGIAMLEAMSQGLPVFGSSYGSLPEVIGEAGKASNNFNEFLESVINFDCKLSPRQIRDYAIERFSIQKYTKEYLELYEKVISGQSLNRVSPQYKLEYSAETLLPF